MTCRDRKWDHALGGWLGQVRLGLTSSFIL